MEIWRRDFLQRFSMTSGVGLLAAHATRAKATDAAGWSGYKESIVIDTLGDPGSGDNSGSFVPLSVAELNQVRVSGLTALNLTVSGVGSFLRNYDESIRQIAYWNAEIAANPGVFLQVRRAADIEEAKRTRRLGLIYGFQDTTPLAEDLSRVDMFCDFGVRVFQLTYNRRNLVGDGCLESGNAGLSEFGRKLIARLDERRLLIDLSHAGERTTLEAIEFAKGPVAITHTGCASLAPNPRNKSDKELSKLADKGGYVGIYLMPFLRSEGQPMADDVIRHIEHALNICGEEHVGIGTDGGISAVDATPEFKKKFAEEIDARRKAGISAPGENPSVFTFVPDLNRADRLSRVAELLSQRKHSDERIRKILGGNFARLVHDVWGD